MMAQSNPQMAQAIQMAQNGNPQAIVQNLAKERGVSAEQLSGILNQFGIKL